MFRKTPRLLMSDPRGMGGYQRCMRTSAAIAAILAAVGLAALVVAPASADHVPRTSLCVPTLGHSVTSDYTLLGDATTVTVQFAAVCADRAEVMQVVLAIGSPHSMTLDERRDAHAAARHIAERILKTQHALIGVAGRAGTLSCNVAADVNVVFRCLDRALDPRSPDDARSPEAVLVAAAAIFRRAHLHEPQSDPRQILILLAVSPDVRECPAWRREAHKIGSSGILSITVCVNRNCPGGCMRQLATSARYAFDLENYGALLGSFRWIRGLMGADPVEPSPADRIRFGAGIQSVALDYPLPAGVDFVPGSLFPLDAPAAGAYDPGTRRISWRTNIVPRDGLTVSFGIRSVNAGRAEIGAGATVHAVDTYNLPLDVDLGPRQIWVFGPP